MLVPEPAVVNNVFDAESPTKVNEFTPNPLIFDNSSLTK